METLKAQNALRREARAERVLDRARDGLRALAAATRCDCGAVKRPGTVGNWRAVFRGGDFSAQCGRCAEQ